MRVWAGWLVGNSLGTFVFAAVSRIISLLILPAHGQWEICGNDEALLKGEFIILLKQSQAPRGKDEWPVCSLF